MGKQLEPWFKVNPKNEGEPVEIELYGVIGSTFWDDGVSAKDFIAELKKHKGKDIDLRINSPGGYVSDGTAMITRLQQHDGRTRAFIDGTAASMASLIACSTDECFIAKGGWVMIHNPAGISVGDSARMRKHADSLDKLKSAAVALYAKKTGKKEDELSELMNSETWYVGSEAVENGFADGIIEGSELRAAACDVETLQKLYNNAPVALLTNKQHKEMKQTNVSETPTPPAATPDLGEVERNRCKGIVAVARRKLTPEIAEAAFKAIEDGTTVDAYKDTMLDELAKPAPVATPAPAPAAILAPAPEPTNRGTEPPPRGQVGGSEKTQEEKVAELEAELKACNNPEEAYRITKRIRAVEFSANGSN